MKSHLKLKSYSPYFFSISTLIFCLVWRGPKNYMKKTMSHFHYTPCNFLLTGMKANPNFTSTIWFWRPRVGVPLHVPLEQAPQRGHANEAVLVVRRLAQAAQQSASTAIVAVARRARHRSRGEDVQPVQGGHQSESAAGHDRVQQDQRQSIPAAPLLPQPGRLVNFQLAGAAGCQEPKLAAGARR